MNKKKIAEEVIFFIENDLVKHTENVVSVALALADVFHIENKKDLVEAAVFHDFGKIVMIDRLAKKGPLSKEDRFIVSMHPNFSLAMVKDYITADAGVLILLHHSYADGSGYPRIIAGKEMTLQILQASDLYDALNSERVYRRKSVDGWEQVITEKIQNTDIVNALIDLSRQKIEFPEKYEIPNVVKQRIEHYVNVFV
jgi:HD-GYP domain-containing protein (c-di-GMP phosphodiesterase class II)